MAVAMFCGVSYMLEYIFFAQGRWKVWQGLQTIRRDFPSNCMRHIKPDYLLVQISTLLWFVRETNFYQMLLLIVGCDDRLLALNLADDMFSCLNPIQPVTIDGGKQIY